MTWNYRVVLENGMYGIHEVYYDENRIVGMTTNPIDLGRYETAEEIESDLKYIQRAFSEPVIFWNAAESRFDTL